MPRVAIVSAMHAELAAVLARLEKAQVSRTAGRDFLLGRWHGQEVVLALSRIGKVAAATTTTALIERFEVGQVIFTGVAGGLATQAQVGDVVVASAFLQHDMDASPLFPRYEVPLYERSHFATDEALTRELMGAVQSALRQGVLDAQAAAELGLRAARLHTGLVVSGDRFVSTCQESQNLQSSLPEALAVEMEGAAVAQVCSDYGVPFAAMRTISDRADDAAHADFLKFVDRVASRYSAQILECFFAQRAA